MIICLEVGKMLKKMQVKVSKILSVTILQWTIKMMKRIRLKCCLEKLVTVFSLVQHVISKLEVWYIHAAEVDAIYCASANNVERGWPKHVPNQTAVVVIVLNCSKIIPNTTGSGMRVVGFVRIFFNVFQTSISGSSTGGKNYCKLKSIIEQSIFLSSH